MNSAQTWLLRPFRQKQTPSSTDLAAGAARKAQIDQDLNALTADPPPRPPGKTKLEKQADYAAGLSGNGPYQDYSVAVSSAITQYGPGPQTAAIISVSTSMTSDAAGNTVIKVTVIERLAIP